MYPRPLVSFLLSWVWYVHLFDGLIPKLCLTWLLTTMNIMATIFQKGQLCLVMHGQYEHLLYSLSLTFFFCSGLYCMTLNYLTTPWNTSLNDIWKMDCSNPIIWTLILWFLVLDAGWFYMFLLRCINISWIIIFLYRVCPGRHLADNLLFSIVSCLLAVYDIKPPVDNMGNPIKLEADFTSEFLS